jgi:sugar-specific transcriptional regulator TrmB
MQSIETYRTTLGITKQQATMYELLLATGPMSAVHIAEVLDYLPNAVYRLAKQLAIQRFVLIRPGWPRLFEAVPLNIALRQVEQRSLAEQATVQSNLLGSVLKTGTIGAPEIVVLNGRKELYDRYMVEAQKARHEILVFAIGIAYDPLLDSAQRQVRQKGVEVRHIVQKYTKDNYHIVQKWQRIGVKMRHYPSLRGFHLMVFDAKTVIISFSNPDDTESRTSLVVQTPAAANAMRDYFYNIWAKAKLIG